MAEVRAAINGTLAVIKGAISSLVEDLDTSIPALLADHPGDAAMIVGIDYGAREMARNLLDIINTSLARE